MVFDAGAPIWRQLYYLFVRAIVSGQWPLGEQIPSVRDLAAGHEVNPNTVQKALAELEREALCETRRGLGRYVTEDSALVVALRRRQAETDTQAYVTNIRALGLTETETQNLVNKLWNKGE